MNEMLPIPSVFDTVGCWLGNGKGIGSVKIRATYPPTDLFWKGGGQKPKENRLITEVHLENAC